MRRISQGEGQDGKDKGRKDGLMHCQQDQAAPKIVAASSTNTAHPRPHPSNLTPTHPPPQTHAHNGDRSSNPRDPALPLPHPSHDLPDPIHRPQPAHPRHRQTHVHRADEMHRQSKPRPPHHHRLPLTKKTTGPQHHPRPNARIPPAQRRRHPRSHPQLGRSRGPAAAEQPLRRAGRRAGAVRDQDRVRGESVGAGAGVGIADGGGVKERGRK